MKLFPMFPTPLYHPLLHLFHALLVVVLQITSSIPFGLCEIKDTQIRDDSRPMILFEHFGFAQDGQVAISINHLSWKSNNEKAKIDLSSMGFFLVRDPSFPRLLNESIRDEEFCVFSSQFVKPFFNLENMKLNYSITVAEPDEYSLLFGNCQSEFKISMDVHTEMYNLRDDGQKDFLPAGQNELPRLYFCFFLIYITFLAIWVYVCFNQRGTVDKIHIIMGTLLIFKTLKMICASEDKLYVGKTGTPHGWDVAFYIFGFLKGVMLFTVIVLIGTGWSFLKPYLQEREKKVLMIVIPLQVMENLAYVVISETGPATKQWMTWNQIFLVMDVICCCAVFFPIIWSIRSLKSGSNTDGKAARNLEKLTLFKQFYVVVIGYLYFTRVMVPAVVAIVSYRYEWTAYLVAEGASLAFYLFVFCKFQPIDRNPYLELDREDKEEGDASGGQRFEEDPFEL